MAKRLTRRKIHALRPAVMERTNAEAPRRHPTLTVIKEDVDAIRSHGERQKTHFFQLEVVLRQEGLATPCAHRPLNSVRQSISAEGFSNNTRPPKTSVLNVLSRRLCEAGNFV